MKVTTPKARPRCGYRGAFPVLGAALLLAGVASAQTFEDYEDPCARWDWDTDGFTYQSKSIFGQKEIDLYLNCTIVYQGITIITHSATDIDLNGIEEFRGGLSINESPGRWPKLRRISARYLKVIGDDFKLEDLPYLEYLDIPNLESVGRVSWVGLPSLKDVPWGHKSVELPHVKTNPYDWPKLLIQGTALTRLDFFDLSEEQGVAPGMPEFLPAVITVANNTNLYDIDLREMKYGPSNLTIVDNHPGLKVVLGNMTAAGNLTFSDLAGLAMPLLSITKGDFTLQHNSFHNIEMPHLEHVEGSLIINSNENLERMNFPELYTVGFHVDNFGSLSVMDNPLLEEVDGFEKLYCSYGSLEFEGNFSSIALKNDDDEPFCRVRIHITSYNPVFNCTPWNILASEQWGSPTTEQYTCVAPSSGTVIITATGTPQSEQRNSLTKEVSGVLIAVCVLIGLFAIGIGLCYVRKRKRKQIALEYARQQREAGIELGIRVGRRRSEDQGVVRMVDSDEERPPVYTRVPKPGEVPPNYMEVIDSNESAGRSSAGSGCAPQEPPPAFLREDRGARGWLGWRRGN